MSEDKQAPDACIVLLSIRLTNNLAFILLCIAIVMKKSFVMISTK